MRGVDIMLVFSECVCYCHSFIHAGPEARAGVALTLATLSTTKPCDKLRHNSLGESVKTNTQFHKDLCVY